VCLFVCLFVFLSQCIVGTPHPKGPLVKFSSWDSTGKCLLKLFGKPSNWRFHYLMIHLGKTPNKPSET
uniref:Uncharacterized protein n=1 Tax=Mus spicilegus TaxID=10103 RepID=A0A8C6HJK4_MUSSI